MVCNRIFKQIFLFVQPNYSFFWHKLFWKSLDNSGLNLSILMRFSFQRKCRKNHLPFLFVIHLRNEWQVNETKMRFIRDFNCFTTTLKLLASWVNGFFIFNFILFIQTVKFFKWKSVPLVWLPFLKMILVDHYHVFQYLNEIHLSSKGCTYVALIVPLRQTLVIHCPYLNQDMSLECNNLWCKVIECLGRKLYLKYKIIYLHFCKSCFFLSKNLNEIHTFGN